MERIILPCYSALQHMHAVQIMCKKPDEHCLALFAYLVLLASQKDERLNVMLPIAAELVKKLYSLRISSSPSVRRGRDTIRVMGKQMRDLNERLQERDLEDKEHEGWDAEASILDRLRRG